MSAYTLAFVLFCYFLRAIHDVKATDMGLNKVRFKAEVDFDGRVVTRSYLEKQDIDQILNVRTERSHCGLVHTSVPMYLLCNRK